MKAPQDRLDRKETIRTLLNGWRRKAAADIFANFYLYCRPARGKTPGEIAIEKEAPGEGWNLIAKISVGMDDNQAHSWLWEQWRRLPILAEK